jgi:hypothetical protein
MALAKDAGQRTEIEWEKYDSQATVFSDEPAIVGRLLRHPFFEAEQVIESDGEPVAVEGEFPIAAVKLCSFERKDGGHANILALNDRDKREYVRENLQEETS